VPPPYESKKEYKQRLAADADALDEQQRLLYRTGRYALLVIFQGMDAAGKDGVIRHVMSGVDPQGVHVFSFKQPSAEELAHDFLWRTTLRLPARGRIGIFNRSYYEEVLVVRVHPELLEGQRLPPGPASALWQGRYRSIVESESHLHRNGTRIVKFFLHLSEEEQRQRFLARADDPGKTWKLTAGDLEERALWKRYMKAYGTCLGATSTATAPWYVVPADDKKTARLIVARVIVQTLQGLGLSEQKPDKARRKEVQALRKRLAADK
jgi:PPK2 family polyphosphate:nucleotide phosphotransferase